MPLIKIDDPKLDVEANDVGKLKLSDDDEKAISSFGLLTAKPILYVANVDEIGRAHV